MTQTPREFDPNETTSAQQPRTAGTSGYAGDGYADQASSTGTDPDMATEPATAPYTDSVAAKDGPVGTARTERSDSVDPEPRRVTRAGMVWVAVASALVVLILLIAFILQNQDYVQVKFFGLQGAVALGIALFIAAVGGGVLVAIAGAARIIQLRLAAHRQRIRSSGRR
ncbi:LapA family protein [Pseudarthrobacter sp. MM222]|uniref:LapA family protein n=1 Tax=Pseudarthrobacter sp. MM222 TaxID=3018929 RepID=UPI0022200CD9|nr:lipopolysaccharide assembly protein LapA domain-containing protein [Pseudarthrobacter sp. MM222]